MVEIADRAHSLRIESPLRNQSRHLRVIARPFCKNATKIPYNRLLYEAMATQGVDIEEYSSRALLTSPWDIFHIHWPESLLETSSRAHAWLSARKFLALMDLCRWKGTRIVWTAHDLEPHEYVFPAIERQFWAATMRRLDGVIALSKTGLTAVRERFPGLARVPSFVVPHGHFRDAYPRGIDRQAARQALGIAPDVPVVAYFGQIRPYKNVPHLIRVFREAASPESVLLVCGRINKRVRCGDDVREAAAGDPRVRLELRFVADEEVQYVMGAADLVVCPFTDILHSGSAILGLSFDRPVLLPDIGAMSELQDEVGSEWVRTYGGPLTGGVLQEAVDWARAERRTPSPPLDHLDWASIGRQTVHAYHGVIAGGSVLQPHVPAADRRDPPA